MDLDYTKLGAKDRPADPRDILLGAVQAPVTIPAAYIPDVSYLVPNFQGQTPTCGAHAGTHLKAILDKTMRYNPRFSWIKIKLIDGVPLEDGTDMRFIFKSLQADGADDFEPLENDVTLPLATYSEASALTPDEIANAKTKLIASYAFGATDFNSLCQAIYQNKAVLLLIKCDNGFWGTNTPTFTTPTYGHFIVAYGYDADTIYIVDSADQNFHFKKIHKQFIQPQFILEAGTAVDLHPVVQAIATNPTIATTLTPEQKQTVFQEIFAIMKQTAGLILQELGQQ